MTFKELSKKLQTSIQTLPNIIKVLAEGFDNMEGGEPEPIIPFHPYSEIEHQVGIYYHDNIGEAVYEKCIPRIDIPNGSYHTGIDIGSEANEVLEVKTFGTATVSGNKLIPEIYTKVTYTPGSNTTIHPSSLIGAEITGATILVRYTKSSTPENDTKNDGDEEKNIDER